MEMNEQTAQLLQGLADKLGTTSAYLWGVLVKQAPISSTIALVEYVLIFVLLAALFRFRVAIGKFFRGWFESEEVSAFLASAVFVIVLVVLLLAVLFSVSTTITGFLNPEYWALNKVLSTVKK